MKLIYGKTVAEKILSRLAGAISSRQEKPGLAVLLIGDDKASKLYVNLKEKKAKEIGMNFFRYDLTEKIAQAEVLELIEKLNMDTLVSGIIVQLPLPKGFDTQEIINAIAPEKDADGFHPKNTELFLKGGNVIAPVFPRAILQLIKSASENLEGKKGVVIANSDEFGKIMSAMLERENIAAGYVLSENIPSQLGQIKDADVVVSAVGSPGLLRGGMLKDGSIVIDGGIEKLENKILGDVDFASTQPLSGNITPVPGGVGPVTIACLLENVYLAFRNRL